MTGRRNAGNFRFPCGKHGLDEARLTSGEDKQSLDPDHNTHEDGKRGREGERSDEGSKVQKKSRDEDCSGKQPAHTSVGIADGGNEISARAHHDTGEGSSSTSKKTGNGFVL